MIRPLYHLTFLSRAYPSRWYGLVLLDLLIQSCLAQSPPPIVATSDPTFLGYDGLWSGIKIRIGTPEQYLSVFPSTLSQETWVAGPSGCDGTSLCATQRGGLFTDNQSTTFQPLGLYELTSQYLDYGYYGLDTIAMNDEISVPDQIIAVLNSTKYWVGRLGLGVQQTRFDGTVDNLSLLSSLAQDRSFIPSHSYGYTAGAIYRLTGVSSSLILGGFDANRFEPNNMTFTLNADYAPVVAMNTISVTANADGPLPINWDSNPVSLMDSSESATFTIDSSTPFLWLPQTVCDNFAKALNLTYDETLQLYLYNNQTSTLNTLKSWNLTFEFGINTSPDASDNLDLNLPFAAFDLQLSYPYPNLDANFTTPPTNYFPLRVATDRTQYKIGRAFLQETYLTVDYERNNFSLSQAIFTNYAVNNVNLMAINPPPNSTWQSAPGVSNEPSSSMSASSSLSTGTKAGIAVGIVVVVLLIAGATGFFCIKKKRRSGDQAAENTPRKGFFNRLQRTLDSKTSVSELLGDKRQPTEVPADASATRFEMAAVEDVSSRYFQRDAAIPRNDPRNPAELENQDISAKAAEAAAINAAGSQRSASPVPPYSPADHPNRNSDGISPYTPRNSHGFGTVSSGEQGISPVGGSSIANSPRSSGSRALSSPISPETTMARALHDRSPRLSSNGSSTTHGSANLTVPQLNGRPVSRSPSTGSRFVEQGLAAVTEEQAPASPPATSPKTPGPRFSWEQ